jgi:hypothetical protein
LSYNKIGLYSFPYDFGVLEANNNFSALQSESNFIKTQTKKITAGIFSLVSFGGATVMDSLNRLSGKKDQHSWQLFVSQGILPGIMFWGFSQVIEILFPR